MAVKSKNAPMTIVRPSDSELVITRIFNAPRVLVWQAWTQAEHLMKWSCPQECAMLLAEGDLRVGGKWRAGMRLPDGEEAFMHGEYQEIEEPSRLVYTHGWEDSKLHPGHMTQVKVQLEENDGRTTMTFTQSNLPTVASRDGHGEGWSSAFENLAAHLESLSS